MELIEINAGFQMDPGVPLPIVISSESALFVLFYSNVEGVPKNGLYENEVILLKFLRCRKYTFGSPNDEALNGHPYYKLGLSPYAFFELIDSDLIQQLMVLNSVHPRYSPALWDQYKHYILTFHDSTFECVAQSYQVQKRGDFSLHNYSLKLLNDLF